MKSFLFALIITLLYRPLLAQNTGDDPVLMKINGKEILRSEFEYIYNKNNSLTGIEQKTLDEYITLFTNFKLKVQAAEKEGIDTTDAFREELEGYRYQLLQSVEADSKAGFDSLAFNLLMKEYREGMLLFEISNREIWEQASSDSKGLKRFFLINKDKYGWDEPCYKGIVISCVDKKTARQAKELLESTPIENWSQTVEETFGSGNSQPVKFQYGVFKENDHPYIDKTIYKKGNYTPHEKFPVTICMGKKIMTPESHEDVLGQLTMDYQDYLDSLFISRLRSVSKIEINEEILKTVNNH